MPWLWIIGSLVLSYAISAILVKKPAGQKPAALSEFDFPQSDEGTPQGVVFGDAWNSGWQVIWYGNYRNQAIKAKGGK